jgi:putative transposase
MARIARVMLPGVPFHLTHRGNEKKQVFFCDDDYRKYLSQLEQYAKRYKMAIWAYCVMPNHVHLIAVGAETSSISKALGIAQRVFSQRRNHEREVTGHLWANRFFSTALDEPHLWVAARYVELNPVRARIVDEATDYPWSSARAHAGMRSDSVLAPDRPFPGPIGDWAAWLRTGIDDQSVRRLRCNTRTGEPTGSEQFVAVIERRLGRPIRPKKIRRQPDPTESS